MKRIYKLFAVLLFFSLIICTTQASADTQVTDNTLSANTIKNETITPSAGGLSYSEFFRGWNEWYYSIINRPFNLHINDIFIGKLFISKDNRLEISTPISESTTTRITFENRGMTGLHDTGRPFIGLGITSHLHRGVSFDTSVNFDLSNPSNVTFLLSLPAIRF